MPHILLMGLLSKILFLHSFWTENAIESLKEVKELDISLQDILAELGEEENKIKAQEESLSLPQTSINQNT